jgi:pimeloyl-ACP methyl ester carboxylesterase
MSPPNWHLRERTRLSGGVVAHDRLGSGPPLVLVHGTPSWSFLWRRVAPMLATDFAVHMFDLLGYGDSEQGDALDVSIAAQARLLAELLDLWGLDQPLIAGHDIGGAIMLRAHLVEGRGFDRIALVDSVVFNPWLTPTTMHIRAHLDTYRTMPVHIYEQVVTAHLRTAVHRPLDEETLAGYTEPWRGASGQAAYFHKIAQFAEADTAELEPLLGKITAPALIVWGENDGWIAPAVADRLHRAIAGSRVRLIPGAGHFCTEDAPEAVAEALGGFFRGSEAGMTRS